MVKTIDYYSYWNKNREQKKQILDREIKSIEFIKKARNGGKEFLDLGCGNGNFLSIIKTRMQLEPAFGFYQQRASRHQQESEVTVDSVHALRRALSAT